MTRPLRLEFAGAVWHVTSRGNERKEIFRDDEDRTVFLRLLARMSDRFTWRIHAFVLMGNHYHLLLDTPEPNLSRGMRELNGIYTQRFNKRHERVGHLMQGRFKGILVEKESHLLELTRYVVLNPVRAGFVSHPEEWLWSSFRATAGLCDAPRWLEAAWTLQQFAPRPATARRLYRAFVDAGIGNPLRPWQELRGQIFLGSDAFHSQIRARIEGQPVSDEVPRSQRLPTRPSLDQVIAATARAFGVSRQEVAAGRGGPARAVVAFLARSEALERCRGIARVLSISPAHAAKLAALGERMVEKDPLVRRRALQLALRCRKSVMAKCQT
jgi:putative transposase